MYSQVGSQEAASIIQKGVLHGGVGEGDVLLGEARVPFSLLKEVPLPYVALRVEPSPPTPPQQSSRTTLRECGGGLAPNPHLAVSSSSVDGGNVSRDTGFAGARRGVDQIVPAAEEKEGDADKRTADSGLLGIGVRMVFPKPTMPLIPDPFSPSSSSSSKCGSGDLPASPQCAGGRAEVGMGAASGSSGAAGNGILLSVYEAEALVSFSVPARPFSKLVSFFA